MARHQNLLAYFPRRRAVGRRKTTRPFIPVLVLAVSALVYCAVPFDVAESKNNKGLVPQTPPPAGQAGDNLPDPVTQMRDAILAAVHSGRIEDLKTAIDWNELKPDFGETNGDDPVKHLKKLSADGEGREILAALADILAVGPAKVALGRDLENTAVYVWPYLAERPLDKLTPREEVDLYRLMPPAAAKAMREGKKWTWWRLALGADGTWYSLLKQE